MLHDSIYALVLLDIYYYMVLHVVNILSEVTKWKDNGLIYICICICIYLFINRTHHTQLLPFPCTKQLPCCCLWPHCSPDTEKPPLLGSASEYTDARCGGWWFQGGGFEHKEASWWLEETQWSGRHKGCFGGGSGGPQPLYVVEEVQASASSPARPDRWWESLPVQPELGLLVVPSIDFWVTWLLIEKLKLVRRKLRCCDDCGSTPYRLSWRTSYGSQSTPPLYRSHKILFSFSHTLWVIQETISILHLYYVAC